MVNFLTIYILNTIAQVKPAHGPLIPNLRQQWGNVKTLSSNTDALHFLAESFKHCKPIACEGSAKVFLQQALAGVKLPAPGVRTNGNLEDFVKDIKHHRFWEREVTPIVPA